MVEESDGSKLVVVVLAVIELGTTGAVMVDKRGWRGSVNRIRLDALSRSSEDILSSLSCEGD